MRQDSSDDELERSFNVSYHDMSLTDGEYDVSFDMTADAQQILFRALAERLDERVRDGVFPKQEVHLWKRLADQHQKHPPWIEPDDEDTTRTYDLTLSEWEYHILTKIMGEQMADILGPEAAQPFIELYEAWRDITDQMLDEQRDPGPDIDTTTITIDDGTQFTMYHDLDNDETWYRCTECDTMYAGVGDEHECIENND